MGADQATDVLPPAKAAFPGQVVLALQGGGALGAYQAGVYQAMHEAGMEPDWVIGTSIGAINGAIIAGNKPKDRLARLHQFWDKLDAPDLEKLSKMWCGLDTTAATTLLYGISQFFKPNPASWMGPLVPLGVERAAYYSTEPLRENLLSLVDFEYIKEKNTRLTVGAVGVNNGEMHYFSSRDGALGPDHIMASCALPPAFPAVRIAGEAYWDGGIYSNTPIEAVLDDYPRRSSLIFTVQLWSEKGVEPDTIWQVMGRQKDIQYASRAKSHLARQQQIHRLRHVIRELAGHIKEEDRRSLTVKELTAWGCGTTMHVVSLNAPLLAREDPIKDIDFTPAGIRSRWQAGYMDSKRMIEQAPWEREVDPLESVVIHETP